MLNLHRPVSVPLKAGNVIWDLPRLVTSTQGGQIHLLAGAIPEDGCWDCLKHPHPPQALFVWSVDHSPLVSQH